MNKLVLYPHVLMVTKPMSPPWSDSSKNLAKDIALNCQDICFHLMGRRGFDFQKENIVVEDIYRNSGGYSPAFSQNIRAFLRLVQRDKLDLYHFFFAPNYLTSKIIKMLLKFKEKLTIHTICSLPLFVNNLKKYIFSDMVVALSDYTKKTMEKAGIKNIVKINPGIEIPDLKRSNNQVLRDELQVSNNPIVLYPGDYIEDIHLYLIRAFKKVLKRIPDANLVMACRLKKIEDIKKEKAAMQTAKELGIFSSIIFLNHVDDMYGLIDISNIAILPVRTLHRKMDIPLVLLECMAREKPVIISDFAPLNEAMKDDVGISIPVNNVQHLREAIVTLLDNVSLREEMGKRGRRVVSDHFNIKKISEEYKGLYSELKKKRV